MILLVAPAIECYPAIVSAARWCPSAFPRLGAAGIVAPEYRRRSRPARGPSGPAAAPSPRPWRFCGRREASASPSGRALFSGLAMLQRRRHWIWWRWPRVVEASRRRSTKVRASQKKESLPRTPDFLAKSAIRQIEARNKRPAVSETSGICERRPWFARGCATELMLACGTPTGHHRCAPIRWSRCSPAPMRRSSPQLAQGGRVRAGAGL